MDYQLGENYRLESGAGDALNLRLMRRREVTNPKTGEARMDWVFTNKYGSGLADGLRLAFEDATVNAPGECASLREAMEFVKATAEALRHVTVEGA